jgi:RNA polymerase sigma factor (TIGR02999 family)
VNAARLEQAGAQSCIDPEANAASLLWVSDSTGILNRAQAGDTNAIGQLLPLVYTELRRLAAHKLANEAPGRTLQPTALVHEVWIRLAGSARQQWRGRSHFFGAAAEAMRRILIDQARRKAALKRGEAVAIEELHESRIESPVADEEVLAVNEALDDLAREEPVSAQVVKLRYFVGLTVDEVASALELSPRTVNRHWEFARAWLKRAIRGDPLD